MEYQSAHQNFKNRVLGLFAVLGPLVGWCLLQTLEIIFLYEKEQPLRQDFMLYASLLLMVSYMLGVMPALVCGAIMGQQWITRTSFIPYCAIGFCVGALSCIVTWGAIWVVFVGIVALQQGWVFFLEVWPDIWETTSWVFLILIAIGGTASLGCTIIEAALHRYKKNWLR